MSSIYFWSRVVKRLLIRPVQSIRALSVIGELSGAIGSGEVRVLFFDRLAVHFSFCAAVADDCVQKGLTPAYLVSDANHPLLTRGDSKIRAYFLPPGFEIFIRLIHVPFLITAASNLDVHCRNGVTKLGHLFHSPVSLHYVYRDSAFDAYDFFFCVGPHHSKEITQVAILRGWKDFTTYESGYPKIDAMVEAATIQEREDAAREIRTVLFAPSWGEKNVLRSHGSKIIQSLLEENFQVVLRPHKHSFDFDMDVLEEIVDAFSDQDFKLDDSMGFDSMLESDLLISDWSGIAFEFAFSMRRPVVFVEVEGGRKVQSELNRTIPVAAMEDVCRYDVGLVCGPAEVVSSVSEAVAIGKEQWRCRIKSVQHKYFFNFGDSACAIADQIVELAGVN